MLKPADNAFMAEAIALAKKGRYSSQPNPQVGCVIVKDGQIIGRGWHERAGAPHAEVHALREAGDNAIGATAYVSLEPCSHYGRTPPCANALIHAGIARVVYGMCDPNPQVSGRGLALLKEAGIEVDGPLLEADAKALNPAFIYRMQNGKPYVISKIAASLDGRSAMASGESQWITGAQARSDVQKLRAQSDVIITGIGTVLADDPALTVRDEALSVNGILRQALKVIIDSHLRIPLEAKILNGPCLVVYAQDDPAKRQQLEALGITCLPFPNASNQVDLAKVLAYLASQPCNQIMIEAGHQLNGAFLKDDLIDELRLYLAATFLGSNAQPLMQLPLTKMAEQKRFIIQEMRPIGDDIRLKLTR